MQELKPWSTDKTGISDEEQMWTCPTAPAQHVETGRKKKQWMLVVGSPLCKQLRQPYANLTLSLRNFANCPEMRSRMSWRYCLDSSSSQNSTSNSIFYISQIILWNEIWKKVKQHYKVLGAKIKAWGTQVISCFILPVRWKSVERNRCIRQCDRWLHGWCHRPSFSWNNHETP